MIRAKLIIEGSPRGMAKQFRQFVKEGLYWLIDHWHDVQLPTHFKPAARRRYKYAPRGLKYMRSKKKRQPLAGPLEFSGRSKRQLTRSVKISGSAKKATGTMQAPRYFWMKPPGGPDKPAEATAVTKGEAVKMARLLNDQVTKKLNNVKDKRVIR